MTPQGERFLLIILVFMSIALLLFMASSCSTDQPPCPDCWLAVPKTQPARL